MCSDLGYLGESIQRLRRAVAHPRAGGEDLAVPSRVTSLSGVSRYNEPTYW
jgi:hypothetical protein